MGKTWLAGLLGALLVGVLPTAVVLVATDHAASDQRTTNAAARGIVQTSETDDGDHDSDSRRENSDGRGGGPPSWAHSHAGQEHGVGRGAGPSWKDAWRELTPVQRAHKMTALAQAHSDGMKKWADCVTTAGNDTTKRATCVKPVPPGLAKRQP